MKLVWIATLLMGYSLTVTALQTPSSLIIGHHFDNDGQLFAGYYDVDYEPGWALYIRVSGRPNLFNGILYDKQGYAREVMLRHPYRNQLHNGA